MQFSGAVPEGWLERTGRVYAGRPFPRVTRDAQHATVRRDWREANANGKKLEPQRFKGLAEMDASQLWDTTMDPEHRTLLQVTLDDAATADRLFTVLMGEDVPSRREFIETNAQYVQNLDV